MTQGWGHPIQAKPTGDWYLGTRICGQDTESVEVHWLSREMLFHLHQWALPARMGAQAGAGCRMSVPRARWAPGLVPKWKAADFSYSDFFMG